MIPGGRANSALTLVALFIVTVQPPVPEQAPDQPEKPYPLAVEAGGVTEVPPENVAGQVVGQAMPEGELVTLPGPKMVTVSVGKANVAVTLLAPFIVTVQVPVPEQAP